MKMDHNIATPLSNLVNTFTKGFHKFKSKTNTMVKNVTLPVLYTKIVTAFLNAQTFKII